MRLYCAWKCLCFEMLGKQLFECPKNILQSLTTKNMHNWHIGPNEFDNVNPPITYLSYEVEQRTNPFQRQIFAIASIFK